MRRCAVTLIIAGGLLASCESVCGCPPVLPPSTVVYGWVESGDGTGIPTAVVLYRIALDRTCVFSDDLPGGEFDVGTHGYFRGEVFRSSQALACLELRAFDPAIGKPDTATSLILTDFNSSDSIGVVLRLP